MNTIFFHAGMQDVFGLLMLNNGSYIACQMPGMENVCNDDAMKYLLTMHDPTNVMDETLLKAAVRSMERMEEEPDPREVPIFVRRGERRFSYLCTSSLRCRRITSYNDAEGRISFYGETKFDAPVEEREIVLPLSAAITPENLVRYSGDFWKSNL